MSPSFTAAPFVTRKSTISLLPFEHANARTVSRSVLFYSGKTLSITTASTQDILTQIQTRAKAAFGTLTSAPLSSQAVASSMSLFATAENSCSFSACSWILWVALTVQHLIKTVTHRASMIYISSLCQKKIKHFFVAFLTR